MMDETFATATLAWLSTYLLHSTLLFAAAWGVDKGFTLRASWRRSLWQLALVGAVISATLQSRAPVAAFSDMLTYTSSSIPVAMEAASPPTSLEVEGRPAADTRGARDEATVGPSRVDPRKARVSSNDVGAPSPGLSLSVASGLPPRSLVVLIWMAVAALLVARVARGQYLAARALRARTPCRDASLLSTVAELSELAGFASGAGLSVSNGLSTPIAWGMREVVLPARAVTSLTHQEVRAALAHEVAHLRGRDPLWRIGSALVSAVFFFQPLTRLAQRRLEDASEAVADDWAVRAAGSPIPLASCLASVAEWITPNTPTTLAALVPMAADASRLDLRIRRVLESGVQDATDPMGFRTSAAVGLLAVLCVLGPRVGTEVGSQESDSPQGNEDVQTTLDVIGAASIEVSPDVSIEADFSADARASISYDAETGSPPAGAPQASHADTVIAHPDPSEDLSSRWAWAIREGARERIGDVWVVYRVRSMGGDNWVQGSFSSIRGAPLTEVLSDPAAGRNEAYALLRLKPHRDGSYDIMRVSSQSARFGGFDFESGTVFWLGAADPSQGTRLVRQLFESDDAQVREQLVELMAIHDAAGVQEFLLDVLRGRDAENVRAEAAESLAWFESVETIEALAEAAFEDRFRAVRTEAAEALGDMGTPRVRAPLARIANSAPEDAALEAVEGLGSVPGDETIQLLEQLAYESQRSAVQREAVEALAEHDSERAVAVLEQIARQHSSDRISREAIEKLLERDPGAAREILEGSRGEQSSDARAEAVEALGSSRSSNNVALLERVAMSDSDQRVQRQAAEELAKYGADAVGSLQRLAVEHPSGQVAAQAAESLGQISGSASLEALTRIIDDHDRESVVREAVEALGEMRTPEARAVLQRVFNQHRFRSARREAGDQLIGESESGHVD